MSTSIKHIFLTKAANQKEAVHKVRRFLEQTELIRYEATTIQDASILSGDNPAFWPEVDQGIADNRAFAKSLIVELEETGVSRLAELKDLPEGYPSKLLHTLAHILDGFIGVDSAFYNLLEDSHWLSAQLRRAINTKPGHYWLVPVVPGKLKYSVFHGKGE